MSKSHAVVVEKLTKTYPHGKAPIHALAGVSFAIAPGEIVALMGSSGSGKSTLLNILGGIDIASSGRAFVAGHDISTFSERELTRLRRKTIGIVFQFFNLMPTMTVFENVVLPSRLLDGASEAGDARAHELIAEVGLGARFDHKPHELSGGEMQRVAVARALMNDPEIILADEPTGNLDSRNAHHVLDVLQDLARKFRKTLIMATHSQEISQYAGRILLLKDGKLLDD